MNLTLRDLLWLVVVVSIACAWAANRSSLNQWHTDRFRQLANEVEGYLTHNGKRLKVEDRGQYIEIVNNDGRPIHK